MREDSPYSYPGSQFTLSTQFRQVHLHLWICMPKVLSKIAANSIAASKKIQFPGARFGVFQRCKGVFILESWRTSFTKSTDLNDYGILILVYHKAKHHLNLDEMKPPNWQSMSASFIGNSGSFILGPEQPRVLLCDLTSCLKIWNSIVRPC